MTSLREPHRSPVSLVQQITGTTRADATKQVRLGESLLGGFSTDTGTGDSTVPGEPDAPDTATPLSWESPLVAAVVAGVITAAQDATIRRGLGAPPVTTDPSAPGDPVADAVTVEATSTGASCSAPSTT